MAEDLVPLTYEIAPTAQEAQPQEHLIEDGISFPLPSERFSNWEQIFTTVKNEFVKQTSGENKLKAATLKQETDYYQFVNNVLTQAGLGNTIRPVDMDELVKLLRAYQFEYAALEEYMALVGLEEIYFNDHSHGFYIIEGVKKRIPRILFETNADLINFVRQVATENNVVINESRPNVDATLKDGSRLNATLEPLAVSGPDCVIRKHRPFPFTIQEFLNRGTITPELAKDFEYWIRSGLNIVVCGGTSSGKTSMLNTLGNTFIPRDDRVLILENRKELQIATEDFKYFQTKEDATKLDEENDVGMRELIRWALRKNPDRIIVGEVRGGEAFDALTAWNSGHDGSMCTIHSNSAWEGISKFQQLCGFSSIRPGEASVRALISEAIDIVVYLNQNKRTRVRKVEEVVQVLHSRKHDYLDPKIHDWVGKLKEGGFIQQQREGLNDILVTELYRLVDGEITKVQQMVPLRGREAV